MSWTIDLPESEIESGNFAAAEQDFAQDSGGLAELSEFYRRLGFEAGYAQAARDQLEASVVIAEKVLREHGDSLNGHGKSLSGLGDARRLLYAFIAKVDRRLSLFADSQATDAAKPKDKCDEHLMEGGLGI